MPEYLLKPNQERFQMVEGPFENRAFIHNVVYTEIPLSEADKFTMIIHQQLPTPKQVKAQEVDNA